MGPLFGGEEEGRHFHESKDSVLVRVEGPVTVRSFASLNDHFDILLRASHSCALHFTS